ncbi:MAG: phosphate uptake regulator PhoU [Methanocalculus sp. MSAO_Arc2]|uniref:phosphate uptake regulator PhoU n=1 Tax=Methanocalculus sp. MSAO_Arc2 TaxID=2293855 RepID=UPI000FEDC3FE|nr:MAG: phosphate uptake regulator PhoU [Methanocalculus sp. MSAO_Arc2]
MDIRKIQVTGGASYVLSLPKSWAVQHNIQKNDPIGIITQPDGTLLITADIKGQSRMREKELYQKDFTDPECLFRCLISAYITGFTSIRIISKTRIMPEIRQKVRQYTQMAIGQEVSEETDYSIVLKDILNPVEMPLENTIRRMYTIVKSMHEDTITALEEGDAALCEDVISRDNDIDRLHWLISRQYHLISHNPTISRRMNITIGTAMTFFQISRTIERIADHAVTISTNVLALFDSYNRPADDYKAGFGDGSKTHSGTGSVKKTNLSTEFIQMIRDADEAALSIFRQSMRSFYDRNIHDAHASIESVRNITKRYMELKTECTQLSSPDSIYCGYIASSIARIGEYSSDISEIVINHCIGEEDG